MLTSDFALDLESESSFRNILRDLRRVGIPVSPRGLECKEIENFNYELSPYVRFCNFKSRKLNLDYVREEFLWYLRGDRFDTSIMEHAKMWRTLVNTDGSINSNYGQYVFGTSKQFDKVIDVLKNDKDSRRASMMILNCDHLLSETNDVPCTYAINFRIRNNFGVPNLNMTVRMRSQDAIFGMGNDAPTFSFIHEMMFNALLEHYPDLMYGTYYHSVDSFHVYERHFKMLDKIVVDDEYLPVNCPKIAGPDEVRFLRKNDFSDVPEKFAFSRWLVEHRKKVDDGKGTLNVR